MVANQTVHTCIGLSVAVKAKTHVGKVDHRVCQRHRSHVTMASRTINASPNMWLVFEENHCRGRHDIHFPPKYRFLLFIML